MKRIQAGLKRAAHETAVYMTADLQNRAHEHGWDEDVASSIRVHYEDGKFKAKVSPEHSDRAFRHEYGDENNPPKATVRRYDNSSSAEEVYLLNLHKHVLGGLF